TETESSSKHQLSTIVVSAAGYEQDIKNAPASISVVTKEDIQRKNATNIADLLADVPGIDIRSGVGKTAGLNIKMRGLGNDYSLILIDGRRQTTSSDVTPNGFGESSNGFLPPLAAIERIEVIRGPMATRYGSEAMGGVINIITKKISDTWNGNVTVSGNVMENKEEADSWKTSFVVNGPIINDRLGLQLRGSYLDRQRSERIVAGSTSRDPRPNDAENYDIGGKLHFAFNDKNSLWADAFHSNQTYSNQDDRLGTQDTPSRARGYKDKLEFNREQYSIGHDGDYDFGTWKTYVSQTKTETIGRTIPSNTFPNNAYAGRDRTLENTDLVADSHLITTLNNHKLTLGAEYKKAENADDIAGIGAKFDKDSFSVYAEDEWNLLDNLHFTFGGRYEDHSGFGGHFSPRAYLVWNTTDALTIKGGVSTGYKAPSAKALHNGIINFSGQGTTPSLGNPDLKPETSVNYELGLNYQPLDNLDFNATAFFNIVEDKIVSKEFDCNTNDCSNLGNTVTSYTKNFNADEAEIYGLETSLKYQIIPEWDVKAAYTFTESEITKGANKGYALESTAKHLFNLTSTWHINETFDIWLQHEYQSGRPRYLENPTGGATAIKQETDNKFSAYNLFNLGTSYQLNDNIRINAAANNLLDKDFTEYLNYYDLNGDLQQAYKYLSIGSAVSGTYLSGRNYWLSISYDF
ncbi:MAG: TonB-dependent receptor, partial [Acinetobacter sp.]